jgi:ADP-ribosyl-[dinitrogen reductase] hydrolase
MGAEVLAPHAWDGDPAVRAIAAGAWRRKLREAIESTGYVMHTLEAALWAVDGTDSFSEAVVLAVNLGGDADAVGAVAGQLAGALHGVGGMPERWLDLLAWQKRLQ